MKQDKVDRTKALDDPERFEVSVLRLISTAGSYDAAARAIVVHAIDDGEGDQFLIVDRATGWKGYFERGEDAQADVDAHADQVVFDVRD